MGTLLFETRSTCLPVAFAAAHNARVAVARVENIIRRISRLGDARLRKSSLEERLVALLFERTRPDRTGPVVLSKPFEAFSKWQGVSSIS